MGLVFRKFSGDLQHILSYIVHQLHNGQTTDLIVLKELIFQMTGVEPLPTLSNSQVLAMGGGRVLRIEAVASAFRGARMTPDERLTSRSAGRLGRGLIDSSLALPLLILVAQLRQSCVYQNSSTHVKALANLYDLVCAIQCFESAYS